MQRRRRIASLTTGMLLTASLLGLTVAPSTASGASPLRPAALAATAPGGNLALRTIDARADLVSDGDALVEVLVPGGANSQGLTVHVGTRDVSGSFRTVDGRLIGVVTGLTPGPNTVTAALSDGRGARLTVTDHPRGGPIFSGPQIQPWTCPAGATDAQCTTPTTYAYQYKSSVTGQFAPYDPASPPSDVATTTTDRGQTVPYIVRVESGTMDRGIYQAAVLFTPGKPFTPTAAQPAWNHKVEITGGSGCGNKHGASVNPGVIDDHALAKGFLVASTGLINNGQNCNIVVQAEALMMLREHLADSYGVLRYVIGSGCSGGSIYQQQIANAYPGILDALTLQCSFPDSWTTNMEPQDCNLLLNYWNGSTARGVIWTEAEKAAAEGHLTQSPCQSWINVFGFNQGSNPRLSTGVAYQAQNCGVSAAQAYDPTTNPHGVRCSLQDYMVNVFGRRAKDGFAQRPFDNVGIQYGLAALKAGTISGAKFADLNKTIGSVDIDYNLQAPRVEADLPSLGVTYRSGAANEANNLAAIPIIDMRGYDTTEIHEDFNTYSMRARLDRENGNHTNQVILTGPIALDGDSSFPARGFDLADKWLTAIEADHSNADPKAKLAANRPADAVDTCYDGKGGAIPDQSTCGTLYKPFQDPRLVAGEGVANDTLKCQLRPLNRADYPATLTDVDFAALTVAFPTGVCDYSQPGVGQQPTVPYLSYTNGPGGQALAASPVSRPFVVAASSGSAGSTPTPQAAPPAQQQNAAPVRSAQSLAATGLGATLPAVALLLLAGGGAAWRRRHRTWS